MSANLQAAIRVRCFCLAVLVSLLSASSVLGETTSSGPTRDSLYFDGAGASDASADSSIVLHGSDARWQLQVTQRSSEALRDVTRQVTFEVEPASIARVDDYGLVKPLANGHGAILATDNNGLVAQTAIEVRDYDVLQPLNFPNQIVPIFTKHGCNGGGCHGKAAGQAGFKLSLLGFEPREDYEHLLNESRGRRIFPAVPSRSLLLEKAIGASPHGGGQRIEKDSHDYRLLHRWIESGMPYGSTADPVVTGIEVVPNSRTLARGQSQQLRVLATYSDGRIEDITRTAQFESNNDDLATVDEQGWVRFGDLPGGVAVMARYQGHVGVFQARIPLGARIEYWPEEKTIVDKLVFEQLRALGLPPSQSCDDATFIRRATLDLAGRLPDVEEVERFVASSDTDKDDKLIRRLLDSPEHANLFAKKWSAILRNRREGDGELFGSFAFHDWLRTCIEENRTYDLIVRDLLTATGSLETNPAVTWLREVSNTESRVEDAAQLFLGQRLQCARCHHHPYEKWSQNDYFQMAAFFTKVSKKESSSSDLPHFVSRVGRAVSRHPKTGQQLEPAGLDGEPIDNSPHIDPRQELVDWMVAPENPFFARSLANRYWKHLFAVGLVEPEDDMRVTNPPSNPALLDALARHFVASGYDMKSLLHLMCTSSVYRQSSIGNDENRGDNQSYSRFYPKRLEAEVLLDAVDLVTLSGSDFAGLPGGTSAVALPDTSFPSYFLEVFGEPDSTTACECERTGDATLAQSLHLLNSKEVQAKLRSQSGRAAALAASSEPLAERVSQLYRVALSRSPAPSELDAAVKFLEARKEKLREGFEDLIWALINTKEFLFNH